MMKCRFCGAAVDDMAHHYAVVCPALIAAFDGDKTDPVRSATQRAARLAGRVGTMRANGPCYKCESAPRVPKLSYCRTCSRAVHDASQKRIRARQAEMRRGR